MPLPNTFAAASARGYGAFGFQSPSDPNFSSVSLLLPGNGTNGAQNNTFLDGSANNFTITRNGNTTQGSFSPFSQTGWGNYFDGSGDYLQLADSTAWDLSGDFTIEMWLYKTSTASQTFFMLGAGGSTSILMYQNASNVIIFFTSSAVITASTAAQLNTCNHVALVRSGSTITLYLNGTSVGQATNSTSFTGDAANGVRIGAEYPTGFEFTGYISNARIVKGTAVYTSDFTPPTAPLTDITNTSLLTCQSNRFIDNSTNAFAITRNGDVSVQAFSPFNPTAAWSAATNGGSGYFDGSGDWLSVPDNAAFDFGNGNFTIEMWVYPTAVGQSGLTLLYSKPNGSGYSGIAIGQAVGGYGAVIYASSNGTSWNLASGVSAGTMTANAWNHVAVTRSGTNIYGFVGGVLGSTTAVSTTALVTTTTAVSLGSSAGTANTFLTGYMSNARVVKGTAVYTSSFTPPTAPLTAITNTSLLLNFTNGAIYDAAAKNDLETVGNAQTSTTQSKWGGSSMYFDGTGDWLRFNGNTAPVTYTGFGTANFTIEAWVYCTSAAAANNGIFDARYSAAATGPTLYYIPGTGLFMFYNGSNRISGGTFTINTWTFVQLIRSSGVSRLYINGVQTGSDYADTNNYTSGVNFGFVGTFYDGTGNWNGYIQDLRVTPGVVRSITPPTAPFPVR